MSWNFLAWAFGFSVTAGIVVGTAFHIIALSSDQPTVAEKRDAK